MYERSPYWKIPSSPKWVIYDHSNQNETLLVPPERMNLHCIPPPPPNPRPHGFSQKGNPAKEVPLYFTFRKVTNCHLNISIYVSYSTSRNSGLIMSTTATHSTNCLRDLRKFSFFVYISKLQLSYKHSRTSQRGSSHIQVAVTAQQFGRKWQCSLND